MFIPICTLQGTDYLAVNLGGDPPLEETDTACGMCMVGQGVETQAPYIAPPFTERVYTASVLPVDTLPHRSPIWPGAPPVGPPTA